MSPVCIDDVRYQIDSAIDMAWDMRARIFKAQMLAKQLGRDDLDKRLETLWFESYCIFEKLQRIYDSLGKE